MNHYPETIRTWNKLAGLYEEKFMHLDIYNASYDFLLDKLPLHAKVLELGCGPGNIARYMLEKRPDLHWLGTDVAPNMIELAKKNNPAAEFKIMDARELSSIQERFDVIICGFIIPYLNILDLEILIADCSKLLNSKGYLYLSFVNGDASTSGYQTGSSGDRVYFHYHATDKVMKELERNCFKDIKQFEVNYTRSSENKETHCVLISHFIK